MKLFCAVTAFVFAASLQSQLGVPPPPPPPGAVSIESSNSNAIGQAASTPAPTGVVTGHVYCGDTRRPARLARVSLRAIPDPNKSKQSRLLGVFSGGGSSGVADTDGAFHLDNVRPGRYYVDASLPGYLSPLSTVDAHDLADPSDEAQMRVRSKVQVVDVTENSPSRVDITLDKGAAISGVVRYEDGLPASNAFVSLQPSPTGKEGRTAADASSGANRSLLSLSLNPADAITSRTDDRGRFRLSSVMEGTYAISANLNMSSAGPRIPSTSSNGRVYYPVRNRSLRVFAPATLHRSEAAKISVVSGEERDGVEITIPLRGLHSVGGHVDSGITGDSRGRRTIQLKDNADASFARYVVVEADGSFLLEDVPDGTYTLSAGSSKKAALTVNVHGGDITDLTLAPPAEQ